MSRQGLRGWLFGTLRGRLILSVAAVHAALMTLFIVDLTMRQRAMLLEGQTSHASALAHTLATSASGWLASRDVAGLEELVAQQRSDPDLVFAMLVDEDGRVIAHTDPARVGMYVTDLPHAREPVVLSRSAALVDAAAPAVLGTTPVGWARVGVGQRRASARLQALTRAGVLYALAAILIGSLMAWFMGLRITRRLHAVQDTMRNVRGGDERARAEVGGTDEAAEIAGEFNRVLDTLAERDRALQWMERESVRLIESMQFAVVVHDAESRLRMSNPMARELLGLTEKQITGRMGADPAWSFLREDGTPMPPEEYPVRRVLQSGAPIRDLIAGLRGPGVADSTWVLVNALPLRDARGATVEVVVTFVDVSSRVAATRELRERNCHSQSLLRLARAYEQARDYSALLGVTQTEIREVLGYRNVWIYLFSEDRKHGRMLVAGGPSVDQASGIPHVATLTIAGDRMLEEIVASRDMVIVEDARTDERVDREIVAQLGNRTIVNVPIVLFDRTLGSIGMGTFGDEGVRVPTGIQREYLTTLGSLLSATLDRLRLEREREQTQESLRRLNRQLRTISECNQALIRAEDEQALLEDVCRMVRDHAGYRVAWVGYAEDDEEKSVRPVAWAGDDQDFLATAAISWSDGGRGQGPTGAAIRTGVTQFVEDFATDPRVAPWRDEAVRRGYRCGVSLPLAGPGGTRIGALTIYSDEPVVFTREEQQLLEELAGDLAFGISVLRSRTERRRAEAELAASEQRFRGLVENMPDLVVRYDVSMRRTYVNPAWEAASGLSAGEVVGVPASRIPRVQMPTSDVYREALDRALATGSRQSVEFSWTNARGQALDLEYVVVPEHDREGKVVGLLAVGRDVTERRRMEVAMRESEERYRNVFENSPVSIWEEDGSAARVFLDGLRGRGVTDLAAHFGEHPEDLEECVGRVRVVDVNHAALVLHGAASKAELLGNLGATFTPEAFEAFREQLVSLWNGQAEATQDAVVLTLAGEPRDVTVSTAICAGQESSWGRMVVSLLDITGRKRAEQSLRRLNRELRAISSCNQALIRAEDEAALLQELCRIICEEAGYQMAWVGYAGHDEHKSIRPAAFAGAESGYLDAARLTWADVERGRSPAGAAIRTGASSCIDDFATDAMAAPWRDLALARGYRSCIGLPLRSPEGPTFGVLCIYADEPGVFTADEKRLLEELAGDLAFGISVLRARKDLDVAAERSLAHLQLLESLDRINRALQEPGDFTRTLTAVLDATLDVFGCDRTFLAYPCDPDAASWHVALERTRPGCPASLESGRAMPMHPGVAGMLRTLLAADDPVAFGAGAPQTLPVEMARAFGLQSAMSMAVRPRSGKPWQLGVHQCTHERSWSADDQRLLKEIGRRVEDGLTGLITRQQLEESEQRYREVFENSPVAIREEDWSHVRARFDRLTAEGVTDIRNFLLEHPDVVEECVRSIRIVDVNRAALAIANARDRDALRAEFARTMAPEYVETLRRMLACIWDRGTELTSDSIVRTLSGESRNVTVSFTVCPGCEESLEKVIVSMGDVTDRRLAEREQQRLRAQLTQAQKMEAIGQLAGGVAHDFNNLLTVFAGYGELVSANSADPQIKGYADIILDTTRKANSLTRSLLAFSRKQPMSLTQLDLNETVTRTARLLRRIIGEDIELKVECAAQPLHIVADGGQVEQVLMNLATNARDSMAGGGRLRISTDTATLDESAVAAGEVRAAGPFARLVVSDDGCGMDRATLERIFEPFFTTKPVGKGTGLGLAIIYGIVKQHEGTIRVESEPGRGTTFSIYLPMGGEVAKPEEETPRRPVGGTETLLVAEDDERLRGVVRVILEGSGYHVIEAVDGADAVELFRNRGHEIALVLSDVIMPRMNGKQLHDLIQQLRPGTPVLLMSGYTADVIALRGRVGEELQIIRKPLVFDDLKHRIRSMLDAARRPAGGDRGA